ncbi:MAG: iron-containing alcohol dehydrogenase [Deinococcus sp.]|nr:iron-containing alcohol dehydrogenase [Deinococcus sp.]
MLFESRRFDFFAPRQIVFGSSRLSELGQLARSLGRRALIVRGGTSLDRAGIPERVTRLLSGAGVEAHWGPRIEREPQVSDVDQAVAQVRRDPPDFIIGIGGGSAIDLAKAIASLVPQQDSSTVVDYLETVGRGRTLIQSPLPVIAVPTTAGTGSEVTKNAVISDSANHFKASLRHPGMVPVVALVDPELTLTCPQALTVHSGMDALTQLIESYLSRRAQPISDALALEGIRVAKECLPRVAANGSDLEAREGMAYAALLSGLALANSGLGLAHGVAPALGIYCNIPHGLACAVMLPPALEVNRRVRAEKLARVGEALTGRHFSSIEQGCDAAITTVRELSLSLGIPQRLSQLGVRREQIPALVQASRGSSLKANPRDLSDAELAEIFQRLL